MTTSEAIQQRSVSRVVAMTSLIGISVVDVFRSGNVFVLVVIIVIVVRPNGSFNPDNLLSWSRFWNRTFVFGRNRGSRRDRRVMGFCRAASVKDVLDLFSETFVVAFRMLGARSMT